MTNIFTVASNDYSIQYLGMLFGNVYGVIATPAGGASGGDVGILSTMFRTFNSVILAIGALIVVYVTMVGVLMTAHEGEAMGKKWSNIWIPIRTVLGIGLLVPTSAGYSALQVLMIWVIVQGVGAADSLWTTALGFAATTGSAYAQTSLPETGVKTTLQNIFQGLVCDATTRINHPDPNGLSLLGLNPKPLYSYYCNTPSGMASCASGSTFNFDPNASTLSLGPNGDCGTMTYCNVNQACGGGPNVAGAVGTSIATGLGNLVGAVSGTAGSAISGSVNPNAAADAAARCTACQAQITALTAIIPTLHSVAQNFAEKDYEYRAFYYNYNGAADPNYTPPQWINDYCKGLNPAATGKACASANPDNPTVAQGPASDLVQNIYWPAIAPTTGQADSFMATSVNLYIAGLSAAYQANQANQTKNIQNNAAFASAQSTGWITAGAYYYTISKKNSAQYSVLPSLSWTANLSAVSAMTYRNLYTAAQTLVSAANQSASQATAGGGSSSTGNSLGSADPHLAAVGDILSGFTADIAQLFIGMIQTVPGRDPLVNLQLAGQTMLTAVEIVWIATLAVTIALGFLGNIDVFVLGSGAIDPLGPAMTLAYMFLLPALYGLLAIMIGLAATLAVYLPLIPFVIFTAGAIAWFLSAIEAMVAGPLVALGVLSPSGQHEVLGKAEPALMFLFSIFLRPSLMVFGMFAAMLLSSVALLLVNATFAMAMGGITSMGWNSIDPIELIIFLAAYVALISAILNKTFSVIHILPERILSWIGGHGVPGGEAEVMGKVEHGVEGGARGVSGASSAGGGAPKGAHDTRRATEGYKEGERKEEEAKKAKAAAAEKKKGP